MSNYCPIPPAFSSGLASIEYIGDCKIPAKIIMELFDGE